VAISFNAIEQYGLPCPPARILDIGQSNVYDAQADRVRAWLKQRSVGIDDGWLREFCAQSSCDASGTRLNGSFLGDLCRQIGLDYLALDIFEGRDVLCFDLNRAFLSQDLRESFDLVLNFGTTEHVFNQFNAFEVIHDATKPGGEMLHILPVAGYTDHGYFDYHGRFFFDLGGYNDYEITYIGYMTNGATSHLLDSARSYARHFSALGAVTASGTIEGPQGPQPAPPVLDVAVAIRYRKKRSARFCATLDAATSIAQPRPDVLRFYDRNNPMNDPKIRELSGALHTVEARAAAALAELEATKSRAEEIESRAVTAEELNEAILRSTSWRITAPLRSVSRMIRRWSRP
jgi:hypothetical protein